MPHHLDREDLKRYRESLARSLEDAYVGLDNEAIGRIEPLIAIFDDLLHRNGALTDSDIDAAIYAVTSFEDWTNGRP